MSSATTESATTDAIGQQYQQYTTNSSEQRQCLALLENLQVQQLLRQDGNDDEGDSYDDDGFYPSRSNPRRYLDLLADTHIDPMIERHMSIVTDDDHECDNDNGYDNKTARLSSDTNSDDDDFQMPELRRRKYRCYPNREGVMVPFKSNLDLLHDTVWDRVPVSSTVDQQRNTGSPINTTSNTTTSVLPSPPSLIGDLDDPFHLNNRTPTRPIPSLHPCRNDIVPMATSIIPISIIPPAQIIRVNAIQIERNTKKSSSGSYDSMHQRRKRWYSRSNKIVYGIDDLDQKVSSSSGSNSPKRVVRRQRVKNEKMMYQPKQAPIAVLGPSSSKVDTKMVEAPKLKTDCDGSNSESNRQHQQTARYASMSLSQNCFHPSHEAYNTTTTAEMHHEHQNRPSGSGFMVRLLGRKNSTKDLCT